MRASRRMGMPTRKSTVVPPPNQPQSQRHVPSRVGVLPIRQNEVPIFLKTMTFSATPAAPSPSPAAPPPISSPVESRKRRKDDAEGSTAETEHRRHHPPGPPLGQCWRVRSPLGGGLMHTPKFYPQNAGPRQPQPPSGPNCFEDGLFSYVMRLAFTGM